MARHSSRAILVGIAAALGLTVAGGGTANADTTTVTNDSASVVNLDNTGTGTVPQFNPALGTLTSVSYTINSGVLLQLCAENLSSSAPSVQSGLAQGQLTVTLNGTAAVASSSFVASASLPPSNAADECINGLDLTQFKFLAPVSGSDVYYRETTGAGTASGSVTDPAALAAWAGTGSMNFSWTGTSNADVRLNTEWDVTFIAKGNIAVTVVYTYTPPATTTTSTSTTSTTIASTTPASTEAPTTTIPPGTLPTTGGDTTPMIWIATALVASGFAAWRIGNKRRRARTDG